MSIVNPYCVFRVRTGEYAVMFRYMIAKKLSFKLVSNGSSERDAKLISKLLNDNWSKKHDKE